MYTTELVRILRALQEAGHHKLAGCHVVHLDTECANTVRLFCRLLYEVLFQTELVWVLTLLFIVTCPYMMACPLQMSCSIW